MSISLSRLDPNGADRSGLIDFLTSDGFPFHVRSRGWTVSGLAAIFGAARSADGPARIA
ncbi:hypothetical protein [Brevibacterium picturae]|uniref:hypothetical protein n=1 Tax=Brevibacterium picturae TaxID=260553 RepID=UPI0031FA069C